MINYYKNKLINKCLETYYDTYSRTLDTADYVPEKFNAKIFRYIFKNERQSFRKINKENRRKQREFARRRRRKRRQLRRDAKARNKVPRQSLTSLQGAKDGQKRALPRYFPTPFANIPPRTGEISA